MISVGRAQYEVRAFWISMLMHGVLIAGLLAFYLVRSSYKPSRPREIVTYIDLAVAPSNQKMGSDLSAALPPLPRPPPPPRPSPLPKPQETTPPKPVQTPSPRRPTPPPPPRSVDPPRQQPPVRSTLTADQIREQLARALPDARGGATARSAEDDFPFGWYFAYVRQALYDAWIQPSGISASAGLRVQVRIRVERDGRITQREIIRPSGHPAMDASVRRALDAVQRLRPLPDSYRKPYRDITIEFELTDTAT